MITEDVVVVFENCESVVVERKNLASIVITDITEQLFYNRFGKIQITKQAGKAILSFEDLPIQDVERINKYPDITQIIFRGNIYHMDWPDDALYSNPQQRSVCVGNRLDIYINWRVPE